MRISILFLTALLVIPVKGDISDSKYSDISSQSTYQKTALNSDTENNSHQDIDSNKIPFRNESLFSQTSLIRILFATIIGILLVIIFVYILKKYYLKQPLTQFASQNIKLVAVKRLTPKLTLSIVQVNDTKYVLAQCGDNLVTLEASKAPIPTDNEIS